MNYKCKNVAVAADRWRGSVCQQSRGANPSVLLSLSLSLSLSPFLFCPPPSFFLFSPSLPSLFLSLSLALCLSFSHPLSLIRAGSLSLSHSLSHTHTHTLSLLCGAYIFFPPVRFPRAVSELFLPVTSPGWRLTGNQTAAR